MPSNLGRDIVEVLDDVPGPVLHEMAQVVRLSLSSHPGTSSCECPAIEALAVLYEHGYKVVKADV